MTSKCKKSLCSNFKKYVVISHECRSEHCCAGTFVHTRGQFFKTQWWMFLLTSGIQMNFQVEEFDWSEHIISTLKYMQVDSVSLLQIDEDDNFIYSWCTRLVKPGLVPWSKCISVETSCIVQCSPECMHIRCKSGWKIWVDGSQS